MKIPEHPTLIRRLCQARVKQLKATRPVLAASLVIIPADGGVAPVAVASADRSTPATTSPTRRKARPVPSTCPWT